MRILRSISVGTLLLTTLLTGCDSSPTPQQQKAAREEAARAEFHARREAILSEIENHLEAKDYSKAQAIVTRYRSIEDEAFIAARVKVRTGQLEFELSEVPTDQPGKREELASRIAQMKDQDPAVADRYTVMAEGFAKERHVQEKVAAERALARRATLIAAMQVNNDELEKITWYSSKAIPDLGNSVQLYIGKKAPGDPWLRLKVFYYADDWLFVKGFTAYADDRKFERPSGRFDWSRDHASGNVWEWIDVTPSAEDLRMMKALADAKKSTLRFIGSEYHDDFAVPQKQKDAINQVLELFEILKSEKPSA